MAREERAAGKEGEHKKLGAALLKSGKTFGACNPWMPVVYPVNRTQKAT